MEGPFLKEISRGIVSEYFYLSRREQNVNEKQAAIAKKKIVKERRLPPGPGARPDGSRLRGVFWRSDPPHQGRTVIPGHSQTGMRLRVPGPGH
jgi:hypothetical protein